jgi:soluble lytic murein transglycosylase
MKIRTSVIKIILILFFFPCFCWSQEHFFSSHEEQLFFDQTMQFYEEGKILKFKDSIRHIKNPQVKKTMEWLVLMSGNNEDGLRLLIDFYNKNPDWVLKKETAKKIEFLLNSVGDSALINKWFSSHLPLTTFGAKAELKAIKDPVKLKQKVKKIWIEYNFNHNEERNFLHKYSQYLTSQDHFNKVDSLMWQKKNEDAKKLIRFLSHEQKHLFKTRLAFLENSSDKETLLQSVASHLKNNEGLIFSIMHRVVIEKDHDKFNRYFTDINGTKNKFFHNKWCNLLAIETRNLLEDGYKENAYDLSLKLCRSTPTEIVEAEWFSGWISLRFLKNSNLALKHFSKLEEVSKMPLSKSRAFYWLARSYEDSGLDNESKEYYHKASEFPLTYYGQLALTKIGQTHLKGFFHEASFNKNNIHETLVKLRKNNLISAAYVLSYTQYYHLAHVLISNFLENCHSEEEKQIVIELVRFDDKKDLALVAAKKASTKKVINLSACYPYYQNSFINDPALVNSLIRQESLFNPHAVSQVGATGLMQLMPATADKFARRAKVRLPSVSSLTNPHLNMRIGTEYVDFLKNRFNNYKILAIASYNAGEHRADDWIKRFGDPRKINSLDEVVDWVEKIPFGETRNYVQRVLENIQIYRSILQNKKDLVISIEKDLNS